LDLLNLEHGRNERKRPKTPRMNEIKHIKTKQKEHRRKTGRMSELWQALQSI
jgi:hypothetical protein